jgi:glucosamine-6-phosphate deaminase
VSRWRVDELRVDVRPHDRFGPDVATEVAAAITQAIAARGHANVMLATGNSQFPLYAALPAAAAAARLDWSAVTVFHMDEYGGLGADHPASFARYISERVVDVFHPGTAHLLDGTADPDAECDRYAALLAHGPIDVCCLGIGENGHLAFNDPAVADARDPRRVKVVELDDACRRQQVGEGHFPSVAAVPARAITVTIPTLLTAGTIVAIVPERRKAGIVRRTLTEPIGAAVPATYLRQCAHASLWLDPDSAAEVCT